MTLPIPSSSSTPSKKPRSKDEKVAHGVELGAKTVASGIGTAFGASKLRDAYRDDLKQKHGDRRGERKFEAKVAHGEKRLTRVTGAKTAGRAAQLARTGRPNFKHLVTLVGAGSVATGAGRYQKAEQWFRDRRAGRTEQSKASPGYEGARRAAGGNPMRVQGGRPKHAVKPYVGQRRKVSRTDKLKIQMMVHEPKILGAVDGVSDIFKAESRVDTRATLKPITPRETAMSKSAFGVEGVEIIKADDGTSEAKPSGQRRAAAAVFGPYHSAVAGKQGKKLGAVGSTLGHGIAGATAGSLVGAAVTRGRARPAGAAVGNLAGSQAGMQAAVNSNTKKGRYKPEVAKSAFGVEGVEVLKADAHAVPLAVRAGRQTRREGN